jgi:hypothetical protein
MNVKHHRQPKFGSPDSASSFTLTKPRITVALGLVLSVALIFNFIMIDQMQWRQPTIGRPIQEYPTVLVTDNQVASLVGGRSGDDRMIHELIINQYLSGMYIRRLSCSPLYYTLPARNDAFAWVFLHTADPNRPIPAHALTFNWSSNVKEWSGPLSTNEPSPWNNSPPLNLPARSMIPLQGSIRRTYLNPMVGLVF